MKLLVLISLVFLLGACGEDTTYTVEADLSGIQAEIDELDYRVSLLEAANEAQVQILEIIDPCGDHPVYMDEVILQTSEGVMAWYIDTGLMLLEDGQYYTTDRQSCRFSVINGQYQEGH